MNIIPEPTVVVLQMIPFLLTVTALYYIIFKPMLGYLSERDGATGGARQQAEDMQAQINEKLSSYEESIATARSRIALTRSSRRADAMTAYNERIAAARGESDTKMDAARQTLSEDQEAARQELKGTTAQLATQISSRVLGREIAAG